MFKPKIIALVLLLSACQIGSSTLSAQKKNLVFKNYSSEQGLSQNTVKAIAQDKLGFIWLGTENGLNKFDGYQITTYYHDIDAKTSVSSGIIKDIVVDKYNQLWIATDEGLNCFNQESETFDLFLANENDPTSILCNNLTCVFIDSENYLWVGSNKGLNRTTLPISKNMNTAHLTFKNFSAKLSNKNITFIYEDIEKELWVATKNGLNKLDKTNGNALSFFPAGNSVDNSRGNEITSIVQDRKFRFWIGTENGLFWFNEVTSVFTNLKEHSYFQKNKSANQIKYILTDHSGKVFIGTYGNGLLLFSEKENYFYSYKNQAGNNQSLARNYVPVIFEDESKTLFVSTVGGGFCTANINTKDFFVFKEGTNNYNSLNGSIVRAVFCSNNSTIWLGLEKNGLDKFDVKKSTFTHVDFHLLKQNNISPTVKSICPEDSVNLWLGTFEKGLILFNIKTGLYKEKKYLQNGTLRSIKKVFDVEKDEKGNIWVASIKEGLYFFNINTGKNIHYNADNKGKYSIASNLITSIYIDKKNRVWFTTWGKGFGVINQISGEIKQYRKENSKKNSLHSNFNTTIYEEENGIFWIGTSVGLCRFDSNTEKFENYNRKHGLVSEYIYAIEEDEKGNLWVSTNHGISRFNKQTKTFINFSVKDGLQGNEFNIESSCKTPDGRLMFGGVNGFNIFHPDSISLSSFSPKISINSFQLFNKEVKLAKEYNGQQVLTKSILNTDTLHLNYLNNFLSFEFSAHDYSKLNTIKYAYKLKGLEKDWNIVSGTKRMATYTNLYPGNYVFMVKSTNADGVWMKNVKKIIITIKSPFWKTTWFIVFLALITVLIIVFFFRLSSRWIINQNKKLEKIVDRRTLAVEERNLELAEKLTEINNQKEELRVQTEQLQYLNSELEVLSTVAKEMKNSLTVIDDKGNLLFSNKAFESLYTLSLDDVKNKYGDNIFKLPFPDYILKIIRRCFNEKVSVQYEIEYTLESTGKQVWIHSNMTPVLSPDDEIINIIIIDTDITEIKQREIVVLELAEQLQAKAEDLNIKNLELKDKNTQITEQSTELKSLSENLEITNKNLEDLVSKRTKDLKIAKEKAEKANQLKTVFLSNLSHEIRTPMNAICGFSSLMSEGNVELSTQKKYSKIINDNVDSLLLLIDNIMDLSKLQSKQIKLDNQVIDVKSTLADIYYMYIVEDVYIKDKVKFELKIADIDKVQVTADVKRFKQIFTHLIDNAIKYTEKGSIILAAKIENNEKQQETLKISVKDTGIGIKSKEIAEIFEHFRTIDDKIKLYRGTGLGLAIVQELLQVYNWKISVESTLGKGSIFSVDIPL